MTGGALLTSWPSADVPLRDPFGVVWDYLVLTPEVETVDALVCFGSRDLSVPRRAVQLQRAGVAPLTLVTGGNPCEHGETEAVCFAAVLDGQGVERHEVVIESSARHTGENVRFGMQALRRRGVDPRRVALVSWPLSARRCLATFRRHFPGVDALPVPACTDPELYRLGGRRVVEAALGELDRLQRYRRLGFIAADPLPSTVLTARAALLEGLGQPRQPTQLTR